MDVGRSQFTLYYQPKIDLKTKRVRACEALIRLKSNGKIIPPDRFLPKAERDGTIIQIDDWVIKRVPHDARKIFTKSLEEEVRISFNISARHFVQDALFDKLASMLENTKDFPILLQVEITETALIESREKALGTMHRLRERGFDFALDDFGTGYASLSYLKDLPIDVLKIDKSFVDEMLTQEKALAIVDAVLYLTKKLAIRSVAEGVEMVEQSERLAMMECDEIQGYFFSEPLPLERFIIYLVALNRPEKTKFIHWSREYETDVASFDAHHMIFVNLLNSMYAALKDGEKRERASVEDYIAMVDDFVSNHIKVEERLMQHYGYPAKDHHIGEHRQFMRNFAAFKAQLVSEKTKNILNLFLLLKDWFLHHELEQDRRLADFLKLKLGRA